MRSCRALTLVLLVVTTSVAGQNIAGDPFPETGTPADSVAFNLNTELALRGVIGQEITRADRPSNGYLYFRMDVADPPSRATASWAVRMMKPPALRCDLCLITDYSPEMARLKVGMTVSVRGYRARDGSTRLRLIPLAGPETLAGVLVIKR